MRGFLPTNAQHPSRPLELPVVHSEAVVFDGTEDRRKMVQSSVINAAFYMARCTLVLGSPIVFIFVSPHIIYKIIKQPNVAAVHLDDPLFKNGDRHALNRLPQHTSDCVL